MYDYEVEKEKQRQKELRERELRSQEADVAAKEARRKQEAISEERKAQARAQRVAREEEEADEDRRDGEEREMKRRGKKRSSYHAPNDDGETDEQMRARMKQREKDARTIREADLRGAQQAEQERLERLRSQGVPRQPRHSPYIRNPTPAEKPDYDRDDWDDRGAEFISSAMRTERQRDAERRIPPEQWGGSYRGDNGQEQRETFDGRRTEEKNGRPRPRGRGKK